MVGNGKTEAIARMNEEEQQKLKRVFLNTSQPVLEEQLIVWVTRTNKLFYLAVNFSSGRVMVYVNNKGHV